MLIASEPWYRTLGENLRALLAPSKLAPLKRSSQPPRFREIWHRNEEMHRAQALSLVAHTLLLVLLVLPVVKRVAKSSPGGFAPGPWKKLIFPRGGGGGGERNSTPPIVGKVPRFDWTQLTPPSLIRNANPRLVEEATVVGPPEIRLPEMPLLNFGDPTAAGLTDSAGPGFGNGFGTGGPGGVGPGTGRGVGPGKDWGIGDSDPGLWTKGASSPECVYCPNPVFSDEARKAKLQGAVLLRLVVTPEGRAAQIHVVKGLGLGLDEKAVEAVREWRFKPAREPGGKLVAVGITVEVMFRLL